MFARKRQCAMREDARRRESARGARCAMRCEDARRYVIATRRCAMRALRRLREHTAFAMSAYLILCRHADILTPISPPLSVFVHAAFRRRFAFILPDFHAAAIADAISFSPPPERRRIFASARRRRDAALCCCSPRQFHAALPPPPSITKVIFSAESTKTCHVIAVPFTASFVVFRHLLFIYARFTTIRPFSASTPSSPLSRQRNATLLGYLVCRPSAGAMFVAVTVIFRYVIRRWFFVSSTPPPARGAAWRCAEQVTICARRAILRAAATIPLYDHAMPSAHHPPRSPNARVFATPAAMWWSTFMLTSAAHAACLLPVTSFREHPIHAPGGFAYRPNAFSPVRQVPVALMRAPA